MNYYGNDNVSIGRVTGQGSISKDFLINHADQINKQEKEFVDPASNKSTKKLSKGPKQVTVVSPNFDAPVRYTGDTPLLKEGDKLEETGEVGINIFRLSDPEHLKQYQNICDNIAKDIYVLSKEDLQWDPEVKNWIVFIRYIKRILAVNPKLEKKWNPHTGQVE